MARTECHRIMTATVVIDSFTERLVLLHRALDFLDWHEADLAALLWLREASTWAGPSEICREYLTYSMRGLRQLKGAIKTHEAYMDEDGDDEDGLVHPDYLALHTALQHERQHQRNIDPDLRYEGSVDPLDPDSVICWF